MSASGTHPARKLGAWLKAERKKRDLVARIFASEIRLSPAEYSELEAGVVRWAGTEQEKQIVRTLGLTASERTTFESLLRHARDAAPLEFSDVYTRDQLAPMRLRRKSRGQASEKEINEILDAVFTPLP